MDGPAAAGAPQLGSVITPEGVRRSLRLNPELANARLDAIFELEPPTDEEIDGLVAELDVKVPKTGGQKSHQRGGAYTREEKIALIKTVAMMILHNAGELAGAATGPTKEYLTQEIVTPLLGTTGRLVKIALGLADQTIIKAPVTLALLSAGGLGYTANVTAKIIQKFNTWGRATSRTLLSDTAAKAAADAAVADVKSIAKTAAVGAFAANQLGILPVSVVVAALFYSVQLNLGTGPGRAYVVSSFYTWYIARTKEDQKAIDAAVTEYATKAKVAATAAGQSAMTAAKSAVASAATEVSKKLAGVIKPDNTTPLDVSTLTNALQEGAPAAALAIAEQEETAAPSEVSASSSSSSLRQRRGAPAAAVAVVAEKAPTASYGVYGEAPLDVGVVSVAEEASVAPPPAPTAALLRRRPMRSNPAAERLAAANTNPTGPLESPGTRKRKGGKTRAKKTKRRVTRRKARKTNTVKFAY